MNRALKEYREFETIMNTIAKMCPEKDLKVLRKEISITCTYGNATHTRVAESVYRLIASGSNFDEVVRHIQEVNRWI